MSSPDIIAFEHFDPQYELGNIDTNGKPIRPRKKPGRKPNPPSPAQRKAQNRAAQRAFRERKRREMREAEIAVKSCLYLREQALKQVRRLNRKVEELNYVNNYLRGQLLTYKMACVANRVDVPKLWDMNKKDSLGCDYVLQSESNEVPQTMEIFLDKTKSIVPFSLPQKSTIPRSILDSLAANSTPAARHAAEQAEAANNAATAPPSSVIDQHEQQVIADRHDASSASSSYSDSFLHADLASMPPPPPTAAPISTTTSSATAASSPLPMMDASMAQQLASIAPQLASHLELPFFQTLLQSNVLTPGNDANASSPLAQPSATTITTNASSLCASMAQAQAQAQARAAASSSLSPDSAMSAMMDERMDEDGELDDPSINHWLQQQNLPARQLCAILAASSQIHDQELTGISNATHSALHQKSNAQLDNVMDMGDETSVDIDVKTGLQRIRSKSRDGDAKQNAKKAHGSPESASTSAEKDNDDTLDPLRASGILPPDDLALKNVPPMNPVDAIHYVRAYMNLEANVMTLWAPTELQCKIPHDARIDYIPSPVMRDHMILFQDYYDTNDLFNLLIQESFFLGGELGNADRWAVPPSFLQKYWFLIPNHRPEQRCDNLVELAVSLGQHMIDHMMERKAMYLERERFADQFPPVEKQTAVTPSAAATPADESAAAEQFAQPSTSSHTAHDEDDDDMFMDDSPSPAPPSNITFNHPDTSNNFSLDDVMAMVDDFPKFMSQSNDLFSL
ncbi:hypothetical protein BC940DRAFT_365519 [Gongronella butleri]|nr:hypothetical protein BC940DRAFT_365519 [Gongronella butleri]